jgi:hypothetical protein
MILPAADVALRTERNGAIGFAAQIQRKGVGL